MKRGGSKGQKVCNGMKQPGQMPERWLGGSNYSSVGGKSQEKTKQHCLYPQVAKIFLLVTANCAITNQGKKLFCAFPCAKKA